MNKPKVTTGIAQKEVDRLDSEFKATEAHLASLTHEEMNKAPIIEAEPQTKITEKKAQEYDAPVIKPSHTYPGIGKRKPEQDALRRRAWELVKVIAENNEIIGEQIELWHKAPYGGEPCTFWQLPVNKPIYIPRFLAEHLTTRCYHRLMMQDIPTQRIEHGQMVGQMVATETRRRLDCRLVGI